MARPEIRIMVGIPASGKSSMVKQQVAQLKEKGETDIIVVSRDAIRKAIIERDQCGYFDRETEVFRTFIDTINDAIREQHKYIYVDATHISHQSRTKLLCNLIPDSNYNVRFIVCDTGLDICQRRNSKRTGFERVPDIVLNNMSKNMTMPYMEEFNDYKYGYHDILMEIWGCIEL